MKKLLIGSLLITLSIPFALQAQEDKQKRVEKNSKAISEMIAQLDEIAAINKGILAKSLTKAEYDSVMHILTSTSANAAQAPKTVDGELNWMHNEMVMLEDLIKKKKQEQASGTAAGQSQGQSLETRALVKQLDTMKTVAKAQKVVLDTITKQLAVIKELVKNNDVKIVNSNMTRIDEKGESVNLEYGYYVVLESFKGKEGTPRVIAAWKKKGLDVIVVYNRDRDWYFVYSEKYNELNTALAAMEKTRASGLVKDAWVHNYHPKEAEKSGN